jgi:aminoglycoside phosphotransferase (APT) family kinase protein
MQAKWSIKHESSSISVFKKNYLRLESCENMSHHYPLNLTLKRRTLQREVYISKTLEKYFSALLFNGKLDFLPDKVNFIAVSSVKRLSSRAIGNAVYSFVLTYQNMNSKKQLNLILKAYRKSLDPVLRASSNSENIDRCVKEFQILKGLEYVNFPVPKTYLCEDDLHFLGLPFIILQKVELNPNASVNIDGFAKNLAILHNIDVSTLGIETVKTPEDNYAFAKQSLSYIKKYLNIYPIHKNKGLLKDIDLAINWLESNLTKSPCSKYCLLHGDYRAGFNAFPTKGSKMVVTDWEDATIGDPAYDVGSAYARELVDLGKKTADRFVHEYLKYHDGDVAERLLFYKLLAYLRLAIIHNAVLSNPLRAYEIRGSKAFLSFPFFNLPFVAKRVGADLDAIWVENFKEFVKENLSR